MGVTTVVGANTPGGGLCVVVTPELAPELVDVLVAGALSWKSTIDSLRMTPLLSLTVRALAVRV